MAPDQRTPDRLPFDPAWLDPELVQLAAADVADPDPQGPAAIARRALLLALRTAGRLRTPAQQCMAARVLVRSDRAAEVEVAQALALAAMTAERPARRLAAVAFDRLRLLAGAPQKFGTQIVAAAAGRRLWPVDAGTTDSERAKWDVPPLAELQRRCAAGEDT